MKTANLEVAKKLALIMGKPLEDFYEFSNEDSDSNLQYSKQDTAGTTIGGTKGNGKDEQNQQTDEKQVESPKKDGPISIVTNIPKVRSSEEIKSTTINRSDNENGKGEILDKLAKEWKGEVIKGSILHNKRRMTRKEYLAVKFKTEDDFWKSPLIYVMFRSEDQADASFITWTDAMLARIK